MRPAFELVCVALLLTPALCAQEQVEFELGLEQLRHSMREGDLEQASDQLSNLWTIHARKSWLLRHRAELIEYSRRIGFCKKYPPPDLRWFLPGKVLSWSEATGRVRLLLTGKQLLAWRKGLGFYGFPLPMIGPHELRITGDAELEERGLGLRVCITATEPAAGAYELQLGALIPSRAATGTKTGLRHADRLYWVQTDAKHKLDEAKGWQKAALGRMEARIRIGPRKVEVWRGSAPTCSAKMKSKPGGGFWIRARGLLSVAVSGRIDKNWLRGLREDWLDARRQLYLRMWKPENHVPAWLLRPDSEVAGRELLLPDRLDEAQARIYAPLYCVWQARRWSALSRKLFYLEDDALPADTRAWLQALADLGRERRKPAIAALEGLLDRRPEFLEARRQLADIHQRAHQPDRALALWSHAVATYPQIPRPRAELARLHLLAGDLSQARKALQDAHRAGLDSPRLRSIEETCTLIELGPSWKTRTEQRSTHYVVQSDLGERDCRRAIKVLESAREDFLRRFPRLEIQKTPPCRVYIFSSQRAFATYVARIFSRPEIHTAGIYSPILGQLLLWNTRDAGELERTLRHEAVHQLMDGRLRHAPPWLHEGLALVFEEKGARLFRGKGRKVEDLPPLSTLMAMSMGEFEEDARRNYAWSAAYARFLLDPKESALLDQIIGAYLKDPDPDRVAESLFDQLDFVEMEDRFSHFMQKRLPPPK